MSNRDSHQPEAGWFKAFEAALHGLPTEDRLDVVREVRSHFEDRVAEGRDAGSVVESFGDPSSYAQNFVDPYVLTRARDTGQTVTMFATLAPIARRSAIAGVGLAFACFFVLLSVSSLVCMVLKVTKPDQVGLWIDRPFTARHVYVHSSPERLPLRIGHDHIQFGYASPRPNVPEVLGWWIEPILLGLAMLGYFGMRLSLTRTLQTLIRRRR